VIEFAWRILRCLLIGPGWAAFLSPPAPWPLSLRSLNLSSKLQATPSAYPGLGFFFVTISMTSPIKNHCNCVLVEVSTQGARSQRLPSVDFNVRWRFDRIFVSARRSLEPSILLDCQRSMANIALNDTRAI
jgi:hypothetical protein